jgi:hypothetical protein
LSDIKGRSFTATATGIEPVLVGTPHLGRRLLLVRAALAAKVRQERSQVATDPSRAALSGLR